MHPVYMYTKYKCSVSSCTQVYSYFFKYWACDVDISHTLYICIQSIHVYTVYIFNHHVYRFIRISLDIGCVLTIYHAPCIYVYKIYTFSIIMYRFIRISLDIGCVLTIYHVPCMCQKFSNADFSSIFDGL